MEMNQEWIAQFNKKCAEFVGEETTTYFIETQMDLIGSNALQFHSDWNWIMEVVDKIQYYRACILSKNHCEIHMMPTDSVTSINIGAISSRLATIQAIDQFIDWYNKQKEL